MAKIGIIGCGWLGKPLAISLTRAHQVECLSRTAQTDTLLNYTINPTSDSPFWTNEIFIISISTKDNYLETLKGLVNNCPLASSIIMMSSSSVYREFDEEVDESMHITHASLQKQAEGLVLGLREKVLILRLGGLMGDDRISGRWNSTSPFTDGPVNYIHKDDVINIVIKMIDTDVQEGIFNLVAPKHPLRSHIHQKNSHTFGFKLGSFKGKTQRVVSSKKLIQRLDYRFLHPDPLLFWTSL